MLRISAEAFCQNPAGFFQHIQSVPYSFLLDSSMNEGSYGRFSYAGANPFLIIRFSRGTAELVYSSGTEKAAGDGLLFLDRLLEKARIEFLKRSAEGGLTDVPQFKAGAACFFSYDLVRNYENIPDQTIDDLNVPDFEVAFYRQVIAFDAKTKKAYVFENEALKEYGDGIFLGEGEFFDEIRRALDKSDQSGNSVFDRIIKAEGIQELELYAGDNVKGRFVNSVEKIKERIRAGDVYVLNLTERFQRDFIGDPWAAYLVLRQLSPTSFSAFLNFGGLKILCGSPELFLHRSGNVILTRPIKGTRKRGTAEDEDRYIADELKKNRKERAELTMITDLERNDLSRVSMTGSVRVLSAFDIEKYSTLFQMTSTVRGELKDGVSFGDIMRATFPGGSVTGAPKISAMKIIDELEVYRRGIYTGSLGYIDFSGDFLLNIVIRSIFIKENQAFFHAGSGITILSDPEEEFIEMMEKTKTMQAALKLAEEGI